MHWNMAYDFVYKCENYANRHPHHCSEHEFKKGAAIKARIES
jgi:hypothetical protein